MKSTFLTHCLRSAICGAAVAFTASFASAQTPPNLIGTWKGKAQAVYVGPTPYRVAEGTGPNFGGEIEYSYVVKQQQGARFSGDQSAGKVTETIIGALRPPEFRSGIIVDHDGESDFTLRNATTMDVCYRHVNLTSKVVACFTLEKQP
ncbi:MAG: hypothetical protein ABW198_02815 [Pseudorhodoplanes sp.]